MDQREGYKKTKIGWIPEHWDVVALGKITNKMTNGFVGSATPHYTDNFDGVTYIQGYNVKQNSFDFHGIKKVTPSFHKKQAKSELKKDDLVTIQTGAIGTTAIIPAELEGSNCHALIITRYNKESSSPLFVSYYINSQRGQDQIKSIETGTTMKHVNVKDFKKYSLPLPPLPEQKKIASILTTVDDKISSIENQIKQTEQLKKGLMEKLLTEGIGHTEFKDTKIGRIPASWNVKKLGEYIDIKSGHGFKLNEYVKKGVRLLKIDNVSWGEIKWENISYLPDSYLESCSDLVLKENDILLALNRPITQGKLKIGILKETDTPSILYQRVGKVVFQNQLISHKFAYYLLNYILIPFILKNAVGSDQPFINLAGLRKLFFQLPPLSEQKQIASILSTVDDKIEVLTQKKSEYQTLKKGLSQPFKP